MTAQSSSHVAGLLTALSDAWSLSDSFFLSLPAHHHLTAPISLRNPFIFYFGHLPAFTFNTISKLLPLEHANSYYEQMFSRGRDPDVDDRTVCHDHPPPPPEWPSWNDVEQFRDQVRHIVNKNVEDGRLEGGVVRLLVEHEIMHVETLCYMVAQMNDHPARITSHQPFESPSEIEWVTVPAGKAAIGRERLKEDFVTFGWDNEFHPGVFEVPEFEIMRHAVTISSFLSFVDAGGYQNEDFWEQGDWDWIKREDVEYPATWKMIDGLFHVMTNSGTYNNSTVNMNIDDVGDWPVSVSLAEACAYARWVGGEVPTEAQWMRAAGSDDTTWAHSLASTPVPVHKGNKSWCGVVGMIGNGWELTASVFNTFEGFVPTELYPEYSQDFFDEKHYVLKGASWATHPVGVRPSFRNFYQARYPYVFSKFRLVREVGDR